MDNRFDSGSAIFIALILLTAICPSLADAQEPAAAASEKKWDEFPSRRGRTAVTDMYDGPKYDDLRDCVNRFRSKIDAPPYVALVDVTDPTGSKSRKKNDATEYVTALYEHWKGKKVKEETHVVFATGIKNRSLGIHVGTFWKKVGFEGEVVQQTVDNSDWGFHLRKNRIAGLCSLISAVDFRLKELKEKREREIAAAKLSRDKAIATFDGFDKSIDGSFDDAHVFANTIRAALTKARGEFDKVAEKLEDEPVPVNGAAATLERAVDAQKARLAHYQNEMKALDEFSAQVGVKQKDLDGRLSLLGYPGGAAAAKTKVDECAALEREVRNSFEKPPRVVRDCLRDIDVGISEMETRDYYRQTIIPGIFVLFAIALAILYVVFALRRRRRLIKLADADINGWNDALQSVRKTLEAFIESNPVYLKPRPAWQGEAAVLDKNTLHKLNLALKLLSTLEQLLETASATRRKSRALDTRKLDKTLSLLRDTEVTIETAPNDPRIPVELSAGPVYANSANHALPDLVREVGEVALLLEDVSTVMSELVELMERSAVAHKGASAAINNRTDFGFNVDDIHEHLNTLTQGFEHAREIAQSDPVQAIDLFQVITDELESLCKRVESGNRVISQIRSGLIERLANLRGYYVRLQNSGFDLEEPEFHPEKLLDELSNKAQQLVEQVRTGDELGAAAKLEDLQTSMRRLARWLRACETAPQVLPDVLTEMAHQCENAKNDILKIRVVFVKKDPELQESYANEIKQLSDFLSTLSKALIIVDKSRRAFTERRLFEAVKLVQAAIDPINDGLPLIQEMAALTETDLMFEGIKWPIEWDDAAVESMIT